MTKRLYYAEPRRYEAEGVVLACQKTDGGYEILLDQTILFPEGGGQLCDQGDIGGLPVLHVREDGEDVWHLIEKPIDVGARLSMRVNDAAREDHSCQHTGEHMLSGMASKLFGAKNVGFHMAEGYVTIDLDQYLDPEKLTLLEREVNAAILKNVPVTSAIVCEEAYQTLPLRKSAQGLHGDVRVVYVGDVDSCTCCGTHCASSGEVGILKIESAIKYKGGTRIWFACGMRALYAFERMQRTVDALAARFSAKAEDVYDAVVKQGEELSALKYELKQRTLALMEYQARELIQQARSSGGTRFILHAFENYGANELKALAKLLAEDDDMIALLFSEREGTLRYQMARGKNVSLSMRELCQAVNAVLNGQGGGNDVMAQGSAAAAPYLAESVAQLETYLASLLKSSIKLA